MADPMQEILASFFVECEELHEALIDALQTMADGEHDGETINVAFRAVHSIKGGAAAFGLDDLVGFAHQFETVMDACRAGTLPIANGIVDLFLRCGDMLSDLIRCARDGEETDAEASEALIAELAVWVGGAGQTDPAEEEQVDFQPMTLDLDDLGGAGDDLEGLPDLGDLPPLEDIAGTLDIPGAAGNGNGGLRVRFRPDSELYESGNEPLYLLRTLADLGRCETKLEFHPPETPVDLERAGGRLDWTVLIETDSPPEAVNEIFEFAAGLCRLEVTRLGERPEDSGNAGPAAPPATSDFGLDLPPVPGRPAETAAPPPAAPSPTEPTTDRRAPAGAAKAASKGTPTVRVDLGRIERLVNLVGELVINQAKLSQSIADQNIPPNSPVSAGLDEFMQLTRNIQESVMMIRAQPVKSLFQRMSRIVREASAAVGKQVRLVTEGEMTEIDKTAIECLADPLTHMIRNAVDHGLENGEARLAAGKPRQGEIRLSAMHKSGRVIIEVADDGGGINRPRVREIAVSKGLIAEDANLSDGEIDQLLFMPGFSTASEVSALSGRGVGMDVVKTQITSMGGRVTIESTPGRGTRFGISLPLTLAVLDGMVVTVAGETLVVPLNAIVETMSLDADALRPVGPGQTVLRVREKFVPVLDLGRELGYRQALPLENEVIALLISPEEGVLVALLVDTIEDQRQVVIKGLQESYGRVHGIAAATILGDGKIALILDTGDLIRNASGIAIDHPVKEAS